MPACPDRHCDIPPESLYSLQFDWHDHLNGTFNVGRLVDMRADVVVQSVLYWRGCYEDLDWMRSSVESNLLSPKAAWRGQYSWVHTPEKRDSNYREFYWRNRRMRRWVERLRAHGERRVNMIPADELARLHNGRMVVRDRRPITSSFGMHH